MGVGEHQARWKTDVLELVGDVYGGQYESVHSYTFFHRAVLIVYGGAGLRLSEGCALRREDIDSLGYLSVLGKGGEESIVPLEDAVLEAVQDWVATHESPWVFPGRGDGHPHARVMQAAVRDLIVRAGIRDIRRAVHSLRNTVGVDLRKRGTDIRDIQDVLCHASIGTTQIYTQMAREELREKLPTRFHPPIRSRS